MKKILIFSRFKNSGGAAIASNRLFDSLRDNKKNKIRYIYFDDKKNLISFLKQKFFFYLEYGLFKFLDKNVLRSINIFSLIKINNYISSKNDIINLHWFHNSLLSIEQISSIKNPLIITLHDSWIINKTSHYNTKFNFFKLNSFIIFILNKINKWVLNRKSKINNVTCFITPSMWLKSLILKDPHFSNFRVEVIPNPLDTDFFKPETNEIKSKISVVIYFDSKSNFLKGGDLLINFINEVNKNPFVYENINFLLVGNNKKNYLNSNNIKNYGYLKSDFEILKVYQKSSICLSFSRSENLPQFLTQAASCGLPLIGFDVDGIPEVIQNNYNGYLIKPYCIKSFSLKFLELIKNQNLINEFSINSRNLALKKWNKKIISRKYLDLFKSIN